MAAKHVAVRCTDNFFHQVQQTLHALVYLQQPEQHDTRATIVLTREDDNTDFIRELAFGCGRATVTTMATVPLEDDQHLDLGGGDAAMLAISKGWTAWLVPMLQRRTTAGSCTVWSQGTPGPTSLRTDAVVANVCPELVLARVQLRERPTIAVYINTVSTDPDVIAYYTRAVALLPARAAVVVFSDSADTMRQCMRCVWLRALRDDTYFATGLTGAVMLTAMARCSHHVIGCTHADWDDAFAWALWAPLFAEAWFAPLLPVVVAPDDWCIALPANKGAHSAHAVLARPYWRGASGCCDLQQGPAPWQPLVSVCIPAYSMHGRGAEFLEGALRSVRAQTYGNMQVLVCDNSLRDPSLQAVCDKYPSVVYLANARGRGALAPNFNHAVDFAAGLVIKPLLQDDVLVGPDAIAALVRALVQERREPGLPGPAWAAGASMHHDGHGRDLHRVHTPRDAPVSEWLCGRNSVGSPTAVAWTVSAVRFLPSLFNLVDTVCYAQLKAGCGPPRVVPTPVCSICLWEGSVTSTHLSTSLHTQELAVIAATVQKPQ
jgi:hypothetical protein